MTNFTPIQNNKPPVLNNGLVMVAALSASGIGRVVGVQAGLDVIDNYAKRKAEKLLGADLAKKAELIEKLTKKYKIPVTLATSTAGVLIGFAIVLAPYLYFRNRQKIFEINV